jgi:DeoR family transcriptional regulator, copper-sensing transcriptional repressor
MKNLSPRQQRVLELVTQKGDIHIEEIRQAFGISQATTYREIQALAEADLVTKIPGGISRTKTLIDHCVQCGQENNPRTAFVIEQTGGEKFTACCSHCGLMALSSRTNIQTAMTPDFFYGIMLNARDAWYVVKSDINLCCRPSALSFSQREDAERFVQGFGGSALDFVSARNKIRDMMAL